MTLSTTVTISQNLLLAHFDTIAAAPSGIARLRQLILQLAVQGRLVEQDPNDELASVLLERACIAKTRLAVKSKASAPEAVDITLASLPTTWVWTTLSELGLVNPRNDVTDDKEVAFVPMTLVPQNFGEPVQSEIRLWRDIKKGFTHFAEGDVVLAKITPCFQNGKAAVMRNLRNGIGAGTTELHVFRPIEDTVIPEYVYIYLKSPDFVGEGIPRMTGTAGQKRVPNDYFANSPFPLPPLAEQRRIVARVDALMALCDALEQRQAQQDEERRRLLGTLVAGLLNAGDAAAVAEAWARLSASFDLVLAAPEDVAPLRQAVLQLAVQGRLVEQDPEDEPASVLLERIQAEKARVQNQEPRAKNRNISSAEPLNVTEPQFDAPPGWRKVKLDEICDIGTGSTPLTSNAEYYTDGNIPWITSSVTVLDYIDSADTLITPKAASDYRLKLYPPGTLIIALYGQGKTRGQISELRIHATINQACAAIIIPENTPEIRSFIRIVFEQKYDEIRALAEGGAQPNLNLGKIKSTVIPLPPLAEQHRIVARVEQLMTLCDTLEARLREERAAAEQFSAALCDTVAAGRQMGDDRLQVRDDGRPTTDDRRREEDPVLLELPRRVPVFDVDAYAVFAAEVVQQHLAAGRNDRLGRVKLEKVAHLAEGWGGIDLGRQPQALPRGPADSALLMRMIDRGRELGAFKTIPREDADFGYRFEALPGLPTLAGRFDDVFGERATRLRTLIEILLPLRTRAAEAVATLYAVWNDMLRAGETPDDAQIFVAFRAFHPKKDHFSEATLTRWLAWMREQGIVPDGSAKPTAPFGTAAGAPAPINFGAAMRRNGDLYRVAESPADYTANGTDHYAAAKALLTERGALTNSELQAALGIDAATARALLKRLVAEGHARQEGQRRGARYVLVQGT